MAEWLKAHAWKACVGNTTVGSNPTLSASLISQILVNALKSGLLRLWHEPFIHRRLVRVKLA